MENRYGPENGTQTKVLETDDDVILPYSGHHSFMRQPIERKPNSAGVVIAGWPLDFGTAGRAGARSGPDAIRKASNLFAWGAHPVHKLVRKLIKAHPDADRRKLYLGHEVVVVAIEACCNCAIMLEPVEEALDPVSPLVGEGTENRRFDTIGFRPNVRVATLPINQLAQRI